MPPYLSHSQLYLHRTCQKKYKFHYLDKITVPVSGEVMRGSAYHKAVEFAYRIKRDFHEQPEIESVLQAYSDEWDKNLNSRIVWDEGENLSVPSVDFEGKDPGKLKDEGIYMLKMYYHGLYQKTNPVAVEVRKDTIVNGIPIMGIIDIITDSGQIIDHKTTTRAYSEAQIETNTQSTFYGLLMGGEPVDFMIHQSIIRSRPDIVVTKIHRDYDDYNWLTELITNTWQQIQSGLFPPNPYGWWCGKKECKYWSYCHIGSF